MSRAERAAQTLWTAWRTGERIPALPADERPADAAGAMAVQERLADRAGPAYGWKLAATAAAGQAHIGVDAPLPGPLFERFRLADGAVVPSADLHMRVAEAEFAFRMGADVPAGAPPAEVLAAVDALHLAIEVPDSRYVDFATVGADQLRADAACASWFVLGPEVPGWRDLDLAAQGTALWINGERAATGAGRNVLGDPRTALSWLAGELPRFGRGLRAGDVVTTGTTTPPPAIGPGDAVVADFGELGRVTARFAD